MGAPIGNNNGRKDSVKERRKLVWHFQLQGMNYYEIAAEVEKRYRNSAFKDVEDLPDKWNHKQAAIDVKRAIETLNDDNMSKMQKHYDLQLQRLENMISSLWNKVQEDNYSGDKKDAINTINRLQKRKAKLLGLDDPEKIEMVTNELSEDQAFEWPDPKDAPQLKHRKEKAQENGKADTHENGTPDSE